MTSIINPLDLAGKRILVTGASSGIGKATAIQLSKLGARLVLLARTERNLLETSKALSGEEHHVVPFDLSVLESIKILVRKLKGVAGNFDGVVHCAGIGGQCPVNLLKTERINKIMTVNMMSFVELIRCFLKEGCLKDGSSIVGISSVSSVKGYKTQLAYNTSKAALDAVIRCLAMELAPRKIRVNSVMPGWVATDMYYEFLARFDQVDEYEKINVRQPLGVSEPYEIANTVAFLLSDATRTITATSILIDGGSAQY